MRNKYVIFDADTGNILAEVKTYELASIFIESIFMSNYTKNIQIQKVSEVV